MASVRQLPSGRWQLRVHTGRDPLTGAKRWATKTVDATGKRDAQHQANAWEVDLREHDASHPRGTFGDLAAQWIAVKERRWPPNTLQEHRRIVARNLRALHDVDVAKITTHTLDVLYAELAARGGACTHRPCPMAPCPEHGPRCHRKKCKRPVCQHKGECAGWVPCEDQPCRHSGPLSAARVHRIHTVVRSALGQAVKWGWIRRNPADHAEPGEILEEEVEPPADVDVVHLLAEAEQIDTRLALFLQLAIVTGARRGAICALRWNHIDLNPVTASARFTRVIVIGPDGTTNSDGTPRTSRPVDRPASRTKRSGRKVALDPYVVAALIAHRDLQAERAADAGAVLPPDAYVFSDDVRGEHPWRPDSTSRKYRHLRWWVKGLSESRLHDLRHFMATQLLGAGVDPKVVAQRGGWSRVATMLDRYAHALPVKDRAAADVLGGMLAGESQVG
jgi:integrase